MARLDPGASARWLARRTKEAAAALKSEYDAGKRGDETPTEPIFPTPREQWAALQRVLAGRPAPVVEAVAPADDAADAGDAEEVASALRRVDWQQVRAATSERTGDAAEAMRAMARQVDWAKVQPVAAQVSSALIAAVAAGRVPVGGRLGPLVVKALTDRGALATRVGESLRAEQVDLPPDFRAELAETDARIAPLPRWSDDGA